MLIPYNEIIEKWDLSLKNILHVGAHEGEEHDAYFENGAESVIWIEANPSIAEALSKKVDARNKVFIEVISDVDGNEVEFNFTNNGQSSSILKLGTHKQLFPSIVVTDIKKMKTKSIETLFIENNLSLKDIDFVNLDIQGAELLALKGMGADIKNIKAIYTEVNTEYVYEDCALMTQIDDYLANFNFARVATKMWQDHPWGDALYINKEVNGLC
jgi:FkbM family methyltransferase